MPSPHADDQEPVYKCSHCPRLLRADELDRPVCRVCEDRAVEHLKAFPTTNPKHPGLYDRLSAVLAPGSAGGSSGHVTGATRTAPLPVSLQPLSLRGPGGIVDSLLGVEARWRAELGWDPVPLRGGYEASLRGCVTILVNAAGWTCSKYEYVDADLKLIASLWSQADAAVNGVREQKVPIGHCPVVSDDGVACGERLKVSPFANLINCAGCGARWQRDEWLRLGATMRGFPMPGAAVA